MPNFTIPKQVKQVMIFRELQSINQSINQSAPAQNSIYIKQKMQKMPAKFHSCPEIKYAFECTYFHKLTMAQ